MTVLVLILALTAQSAPGQAEYYQEVPVDQAVSDLDPLQAGFRRLDPGNAQYNGRVTLYQPNEALGWHEFGEPDVDRTTGLVRPGNYYMRKPGFRAWVDRPDYLVLSDVEDGGIALNQAPVIDGAFRDIGGAGMVYDLIPANAPPPMREPLPVRDARIDGRVNYDLNTRIDGRVDSNIARPYFGWVGGEPLPDHDPMRIGTQDPDYIPESTETYVRPVKPEQVEENEPAEDLVDDSADEPADESQ